MSGDQSVLPGYVFEGRGPAQRRLLEWLSARVPDCSFDAAVAQRSPAGPWAIKVHAPNRVPACAELLQAESWVERIAVRPQHLYVRIGVERLCSWVAEGFASADAAGACVGGAEGRGRSVLVRAVDVDALRAAGEARPLRQFRERAVARCVAALLRSRGFSVELELLAPGGGGRETYDEVWAAAPGSVTHTVVVGAGVPRPSEVERGDHVVHLPVGEVDVRHGPLRARNGGSVSADDVVAEVARALPVGGFGPGAGPDPGAADAADASEVHAEAVLALLLLATPRARRIQLDDAAVRRETETYIGLLGLLGPGAALSVDGAPGPDTPADASGSDPAARDTEPIRCLAAELDVIAMNAGRGVTRLEPALVARTLRSLAEAAAGADILRHGRLTPAVQAGVAVAFDVGGIADVERVLSADGTLMTSAPSC